ncbi:hypothetical protein LBMAG35_17190 [Chlorobiota bacterium]|nr:hypothetical protein LBMAG35_17190 [Chlorobiota bacterium]
MTVYVNGKTLSIRDSVFTQQLILKDIDTINIEYCTFENINSSALLIEKSTFVNISDCVFRNITITDNKAIGVLSGNGIASIQILKCTFDNISGTAIRFPIGGTTKAEDRIGILIMSACRFNKIQSNAKALGNGVIVFHTNNAFVLANRFTKIDHTAITIGRNSTDSEEFLQKLNMVTVQGNRIDSVLGNGILICENAINPQVKDNIIFSIAYDGKGALSDQGDHGIYWQAKGGLIQNNAVLYNYDGQVSGNPGSGISVRSNAIVEQNIIAYCSGNGIGYYADHDSKGALTILNNVIYENERNGIYISASGVSGNKPDSIMILHNTVMNKKVQDLSHQSCPIAINDFVLPITIAGNYTVYIDQFNPLEHIRVLGTSSQPKIVYNLHSSNTDEFVDVSIGDYKLNNNSIAINYARHGIPIILDREGRFRSGIPDAGAFEFMSPASVRESITGYIAVNNHFNIQEQKRVSDCSIYSLLGEKTELIFSQDNQSLSLVLPHDLPSGVYVCSIKFFDEDIREIPVILQR